uniref:Peptidase_M14 domain-containing protein n=1 Tax=Anopheles funestus TaxID=62324 RepID=A0A4Y0BFW4_ANOFN
MVTQSAFYQLFILLVLYSCRTTIFVISYDGIRDPKAAITSLMTYNETNDFMFTLAQMFPQRVKVERIGTTAEGRDINMIVVDYSSPKNITVVANLYAREWVAMTSMIYFILEIVSWPERHDDLREFRWNIVPIGNPDGYEYTVNHERYWNKNRSPQPGGTFGVDLNANFGYLWGNSKPNNPTDETYRGSAPFSEEETKAIGTLLASSINSTILYIDIHASAQSIIYPWVYTEEPAQRVNETRSVARAGADAVKAESGTIYNVGTLSELLHYNLYGTSLDYCNSLSINACIWLDISNNGYDLEVDDIPKYGKEALVAIKAMAKQANQLFLS